MRVKNVILFIIIFFTTTACSTINTKIYDPTGRAMPDPHYVLQAMGTPLTVSFYYSAFQQIKDIDGTIIPKPVFLDFLKFHDLYAEKYKTVILTIEVNNPTNIEYSLYQQLRMEVGKSKNEIQIGRELSRSNLAYRQFVYHLPFGEDIRTVDQLIILQINGRNIVRIGNFRYSVIH